MNWLLTPLSNYVYTLSWRDITEICIFSLSIYALQLWLHHDRQKPLLGYWYAYCSIWMIAYALNLSTVWYALLIMLPGILLMFVLIHQRTLQRNYLTLRSIIPAQIQTDDLLDVLIQTALASVNNNKPFWCIIEHKDSLATLLATPLPLQAVVTKELLTLLLENVTQETEKFLWITTRAELRGINASWTEHADTMSEQKALQSWQQDAIFFTSCTDAIVFYAECTSRTFTVISKGTMLEHMTAQNAHRFIKHHQTSVSSPKNQGETIHGSYRVRTPTSPQPRP